MRFLVDAQLPRRLARALNDLGHDTIHTLDLPDRNTTTDREVAAVADHGDRILVTKDNDFRDGYLLRGRPRRLLHVTTGNITNDALLDLMRRHLGEVERAFELSGYVEMTTDSLVIHTDRVE